MQSRVKWMMVLRRECGFVAANQLLFTSFRSHTSSSSWPLEATACRPDRKKTWPGIMHMWCHSFSASLLLRSGVLFDEFVRHSVTKEHRNLLLGWMAFRLLYDLITPAHPHTTPCALLRLLQDGRISIC